MIDFITEFVLFCMQIMFWTLVANILLSLLLKSKMREQEEREQLIKRVDEIVHQVEVETHNNVHYWFDSDDGEFLAQGVSIEDAVAHLKQRFPTHIFFLRQKDTIYKVSAPDWDFTPIIRVEN